ncbi:MAG: InlB B-repeat-containing protein [Spirochaetales bacterium]|nr:InlB B-repeat-containing protein [Spirochaetales bacterium]
MMKKPATHDIFPFFLLMLFLFSSCFSSCKGPLEWNSDVESFIEEGLSVISLRSCVNDADGSTIDYLSSESEAHVRINLINPQSLDADFIVTVTDGSLFDTAPVLTEIDTQTLRLSFDPALAAEHQTLGFTLGIYAPSLNRAYPDQQLSFVCDTGPNPVDLLLCGKTAVDTAMIAFRLPDGDTDDDITTIRITWGIVGSATTETETFPADDAALLALPAGSDNPLGGVSELNRYFFPPGAAAGSVYSFSVAVIDATGRVSGTRTATSDLVEYSIIYDANGADSGIVPAMAIIEYGADAVISANTGNLGRSGYLFGSWNTVPDGSGTSYTPGQSLVMNEGSLILYAQWYNYHVIYHSSEDIGGGDVPFSSDGYLPGDMATVLGYDDTGSGTDNLDGHHLLGWDISIDAQTVIYSTGDDLPIPEYDMHLYAVWAEIIDSGYDFGDISMDGDYYLYDSIDLDGNPWDPIGSEDAPYNGCFFGNGHTVSGLSIDASSGENVGFFGYIGEDGAIYDLELTQAEITVQDCTNVGLLAGYNEGTIENCTVSGTVDATGNSWDVGGLVGISFDGEIAYCTANVHVTNSDGVITGGLIGDCRSGSVVYCEVNGSVSGTGWLGGLVGECYLSVNLISHCNSYATVTGTGTDGSGSSNYVGGLIGLYNAFYAFGGTVEYCAAYGDVTATGTGNYIGGLVGSSANTLIRYVQCHAEGNVEGAANGYAGGLIGRNESEVINCYAAGTVYVPGGVSLGALIGYNEEATIRYSYARGWIITAVGGQEYRLIGQYANGYAATCLYLSDTEGAGDDFTGYSRLTDDMISEATYTILGWDFATVWNISGGINDSFPYLQ